MGLLGWISDSWDFLDWILVSRGFLGWFLASWSLQGLDFDFPGLSGLDSGVPWTPGWDFGILRPAWARPAGLDSGCGLLCSLGGFWSPGMEPPGLDSGFRGTPWILVSRGLLGWILASRALLDWILAFRGGGLEDSWRQHSITRTPTHARRASAVMDNDMKPKVGGEERYHRPPPVIHDAYSLAALLAKGAATKGEQSPSG